MDIGKQIGDIVYVPRPQRDVIDIPERVEPDITWINVPKRDEPQWWPIPEGPEIIPEGPNEPHREKETVPA